MLMSNYFLLFGATFDPAAISEASNFCDDMITSIEKIYCFMKSDLHYSAIVTLSKSDAVKIRDKMLEQLKEHLSTISGSKEEEAFIYCLDFFNIKHD